MKVLCIVKIPKLEAVLRALAAFPVEDVLTEEVRGYGRQKGHLELYSGAEYTITFLPKVRLEMLCAAGSVEPAVEAIRDAAVTGRIGDGKIFVLEGEGVRDEHAEAIA